MELKPRALGYLGGLPANYHTFRLEESHFKGTDPDFMNSENLKCGTVVFAGFDKNDGHSQMLAPETIGIIPSSKSIFAMKEFSKDVEIYHP